MDKILHTCLAIRERLIKQAKIPKTESPFKFMLTKCLPSVPMNFFLYTRPPEIPNQFSQMFTNCLR